MTKLENNVIFPNSFVPEVEVEPAKPSRHDVRVGVLLEREKGYKSRISELEKAGSERLDQIEADIAQKREPVPDREYDPDQYMDHQDARLEQYEKGMSLIKFTML